jgi:hypothetical protein
LPPSWSTNTSAPAGRGSERVSGRTNTAPTPGGAGSPETMTAAAFWLGVICATSASTEPPEIPAATASSACRNPAVTGPQASDPGQVS